MVFRFFVTLYFLFWQRCSSSTVVSCLFCVGTDVLLRQFSHRKLQVPAVVSNIAIVGVQSGVFQTVAPHLGVLVVNGVDEEKNDGNDNYCDSHKSSNEGQVVLF